MKVWAPTELKKMQAPHKRTLLDGNLLLVVCGTSEIITHDPSEAIIFLDVHKNKPQLVKNITGVDNSN